ncbi:EpsG family protein [Emticicia fluvialis]|uniref:EpsG family protein n=1 Tax=Emticicia fluvialis TaxID=2974474 RepID=UPI0021652AED|nr:EpsG family protein [Emticicia fluvialis]
MENYQLLISGVYLFMSILALVNALCLDFLRKRIKGELYIFNIFILLFFILIFGFRDLEIGTDTWLYDWQYTNPEKVEYGFDFLMPYINKCLYLVSNNSTVFFLFMAFTFMVTFSLALKSLSNYYQANWFLVCFSLFSFYFFYSLGTNIIRQGTALGFLMLAIVNYALNPGNKKLVFFFAICSLGIHSTLIVAVFIFLLSILLRRIKLIYFYLTYLLVIVAAALNIGIMQLEPIIGLLLVDDRRSSYLTNESVVYTVGFRPTFVLFNTFFLVIFMFIYRTLKEKSEPYKLIFIYYILTSVFFFFTFQIPYSDRWGVISWVCIPFLMAPLFSEKNAFRLATAGVATLFVIYVFFQFYLVSGN